MAAYVPVQGDLVALTFDPQAGHEQGGEAEGGELDGAVVARVDVEAFDGIQWLPEWDTTDSSGATTNLPVAVRIRLQRGASWGAYTGPVELLVPLGLQSRTNSTSTVGG